ncbi:hypothetical protein BC332_19474 [Capsicum chinense]|nr:hypothetical protein BC332_19474 [Capsicum chinense]
MALCKILPFFFILCCSFTLISSQPFDYPTANLSTTWINSFSAPHSVNFTDGSIIRAILLRGTFGPRYACGFYCNGNCQSYLFAIFIVQTNSVSGITSPAIGFPQVVWSANRNNSVRINSFLQLTAEGDLVLRDADGTLAWSTNTAGKSVAGLSLTDEGNLVLFDSKNGTVWQSFEHPTDALVPGQKLVSGMKLTASVSTTNWTAGGLISLSATDDGLVGFVESNPPQTYFSRTIGGLNASRGSNYVVYLNGSLSLFSNSSSNLETLFSISRASSAQYMKLESDGHLKVYEWQSGWNEVDDLLTGFNGECYYPMVCGRYGICSRGQCSCPKSSSNSTTYFREIDDRQGNLGCSEVTKLTCNPLNNHTFLDLQDVDYFAFKADISDTDLNTCKRACLEKCSCKAAFFRSGLNSSTGDCYLPSEIFSLANNEKDRTRYDSQTFIKVQEPEPAAHIPTTFLSGAILGSIIGSSILGIIIGIIVFIFWKKKRKANEDEEDYPDHVPGMSTRFSYDDLKAATENFTKKLGEGGFGSVFEGCLEDGTKIAVKCLEGIGQVKKSFLAEVETIGSIHHVNLVQLIGFCAEKSHRLLVYEFMSNGSLEKWIYHGKQEQILDWNCRKKIIQDVAKGLAYLHEECRQKILHLDIKPPNILLDEKLNAKLSDFGLAKLIDRNQSQVMTMMRGTPGYLAPEWLSGVITEKVDVYSFGIVILEILIGRRHFEASYTEDERIMLNLFRKKAEEGQLVDLIDKHSEDIQFYKEEVIKTMQIAAWCLQSDYTKRPSMSMVVKAMEGVLDVEKDLDYSFKPQTIPAIPNISFADSTPLLPSLLSDIRNTDVNTCRDACLMNCSYKAALFCSGLNSSTGDFYLPSEIFSLANNEKDKTWKQEQIIDWNCRKKIIQDIDKRLAYLHEECRQKILHLDIKQPNILLDDKLYAKFSDFGLAKLINRNQSQVMTIMRFTLGYLAPQWLSGVIIEKVDVYSFGIMILEILTGRSHFEASEDSTPLLTLVLSGPRDCYLPSEIFSLANNKKDRTRKKKRKANKDEEDYLDHVPGVPTRFSYDDLNAAMENFTKKLGKGGFGSIFEGCGLKFFAGDCYLPSKIFSLANNEKDRTRYDSKEFIKVQEPEPATHIPKTFLSVAILGSIIGSSILGIIIGITVFIFWKKKKNANEDEEDYLDHMPGMSTKFSYDDLKAATENFTKNLGEGGFGSIFEG